jgi:hypothetical protein
LKPAFSSDAATKDRPRGGSLIGVLQGEFSGGAVVIKKIKKRLLLNFNLDYFP